MNVVDRAAASKPHRKSCNAVSVSVVRRGVSFFTVINRARANFTQILHGLPRETRVMITKVKDHVRDRRSTTRFLSA